jgi:hypothetical protein
MCARYSNAKDLSDSRYLLMCDPKEINAGYRSCLKS